MRSPTFSDLAIKILQRRNSHIRTEGFIQAVRKAVDAPDGLMTAPFYFKPDAWLIDEEECDIVIFEIEDSHSISIEKLEAYVALSRLLKNLYWSLHIAVLDRYAMNRRDLDLGTYEELLDEYEAPDPEITLAAIALTKGSENA